jgi:hypothetical protein
MNVSLDIKTIFGKYLTRDIVVQDEKHLNNYIAKAEREWKENIIGVHYIKTK